MFTQVKFTERVGNTACLDAEVRFMGLRMPRSAGDVPAIP